MSNPKFTPGPWAVNPLQLNQVATADAAHEVAMVTVLHPAAVTVANAALIAAAPDLYAALDLLCSISRLASNNDWHYAITEASAALAKARGQA